MDYENVMPEWGNEGAQPSDDLVSNGFQGGYKPPASIFNWFWSLVSKAITELQKLFSVRLDPIPATYTGDTTNSEGEITNCNYVATANGIKALYNGLTITIVPDVTSTCTRVTLDLNGLGAKNVRMTLPFNSGNSGTLPTHTGWLGAEAPVTLRYHEKMDMWKTDMQRQSAQSLYGTVPVDGGGTGADNAEDAVNNLGLNTRYPCLSGSTNVIRANSDLNNFITTGTYHTWTSNEAATVSNCPVTETFTLYVSNRVAASADGAGYFRQTIKSLSGYEVSRDFTTNENGAVSLWDEWQWVNPPMDAGKEYCTSERYAGKKVYTKLIESASVNNGNIIYAGYSYGSGVTYIRHTARTDTYMLPYNIPNASSYMYIDMPATCDENIYFRCGTSANAKTLYLQLWYIKE